MTSVFQALLDGKFIKIKHNFIKKEIHKTNKKCDFLRGSLNNTYGLQISNYLIMNFKTYIRKITRITTTKNNFLLMSIKQIFM